MKTQKWAKPILHIIIAIYSFLGLSSQSQAMSCPQLMAKNFDGLNIQRNVVRIKSIAEEVHLSGIDQTTFQTILTHANAVTDISGLLKTRFESGGSILGIKDDAHRTMSTIAQLTGLKDFWDAYSELGVSPFESGHKEKFLNRLVQSSEPIIFLVPRNFAGPLKHRKSNLTLGEFNWFLERPESRLRNVIFVFGAYDCMPDASYETIVRKAHQNAVSKFGPPTEQYEWFWEGSKAKWEEINKETLSFFRTTDFLIEN